MKAFRIKKYWIKNWPFWSGPWAK